MPTKRAIDELKSSLLVMAEMSEHALATGLMALVDRDADLACYVIDYDAEIDEMNLCLDNECLDLLRQELSPTELRFVAAAFKINTHLERVSDLAVQLSEHVLFLVREKSVLMQLLNADILFEQVSLMMRESVSALLERAPKLAWKIIDEKVIIEDETAILDRQCIDLMRKEPRMIERGTHLLSIVQILARVAEQAARIAEEVIFMHDGTKVHHRLREYHPATTAALSATEANDLAREETAVIEKGISREQARDELEVVKKTTRTISQAEVAAAAEKARVEREELSPVTLPGRKK